MFCFQNDFKAYLHLLFQNGNKMRENRNEKNFKKNETDLLGFS